MYIVGVNENEVDKIKIENLEFFKDVHYHLQGVITMAHTFVSTEQIKHIKDVKDTFPAAAHITKVCGGWLIFDTHSDYDTWRKQK